MDDTQPPGAPPPPPLSPQDAPGSSSESPPDPLVTAALARLAGLDDLPVDEHAGVYAAVHGDLRDALADAAGRDAPDPP